MLRAPDKAKIHMEPLSASGCLYFCLGPWGFGHFRNCTCATAEHRVCIADSVDAFCALLSGLEFLESYMSKTLMPKLSVDHGGCCFDDLFNVVVILTGFSGCFGM